MVYWVGGKQFACEFVAASEAKKPYAGRHLLSLKCDPDRIRELWAEYPKCCLDIILTGAPGYRWISIALGGPEARRGTLCSIYAT